MDCNPPAHDGRERGRKRKEDRHEREEFRRVRTLPAVAHDGLRDDGTDRGAYALNASPEPEGFQRPREHRPHGRHGKEKRSADDDASAPEGVRNRPHEKARHRKGNEVDRERLLYGKHRPSEFLGNHPKARQVGPRSKGTEAREKGEKERVLESGRGALRTSEGLDRPLLGRPCVFRRLRRPCRADCSAHFPHASFVVLTAYATDACEFLRIPAVSYRRV